MTQITRRDFLRDGVAAFTVSFAAPAFLSDIARAQGVRSRNLVVVYLGGGNDALNTVIPYQDPFYRSRRPAIAVPAGQVLQIGSDSSRKALGLHPRLTGLRTIFNEGRLAIVQRTGYPNSSRSHFQGLDVWGTANPNTTSGVGWLGRYLDTLPGPVDALWAWNATRETPRALVSRTVPVPAIPDARGYSLSSANGGVEAQNERLAATRIASHVSIDRPYLSFVNGSIAGALATLDRVGSVNTYVSTVTYPNSGFALALRTVAASIVRGIGTRVFWVQTGGFDTHAGQGNAGGGAYATLMATFSDGLLAFYTDLRNQGLLNDTLVLQFSEFGRRISENGSQGTDHGAAGVMMAMGGMVRGGIYGTAASLDPNPANPTLENSGGDVRHETDFRTIYAKVLDGWLGADSVAILGGNFRPGAPAII
ncbi:MAG: hypothetical protein A3I61_04180 [Acidobacteria bacterium RIFCSPLOWO2_02_FULL_68_18]|nr:MAG: hypothetical protein A3I61_04180 [Acidobacteria bacterium RIFCSPLOWO2_02_FULL_68_18]OFW52056.1 MAG: hypothetical protein A3G77_02825 [Acidobacteria bacterium RIFCSPLOWO2_12_FULL_68_19]